MEVSFAIGEKISPKLTTSTWEYPFSTSQYLNFSTCPMTFTFFLNTHLLPKRFIPLGNLTKSHVSFLYKDSITSTMESFHSLPYVNLTASPTELGSSSIAVDTNVERNSRRLYLSTSFLSLSDLLINEVNCSTFSSDSIDSSKSSSSFLNSSCTTE
jgi:hypothetical protein